MDENLLVITIFSKLVLSYRTYAHRQLPRRRDVFPSVNDCNFSWAGNRWSDIVIIIKNLKTHQSYKFQKLICTVSKLD